MGFSGSGAGTPADPYQITSYSQLKEMGEDAAALTASYLLMNDIDASDSKTENAIVGTAEEYNGWDPIGQDAARFTGSFDGGGFTISNLYCNWTDRFCGLFGYIDGDGQEYKNVTIKNAEIISIGTYGGIFVGYSQKSGSTSNEFSDIYVFGTVSGTTTGGMIASCIDSNFTDCSSDVIIEDSTTCGLFIGSANASDFLRCTASGSITLTNTANGAVLGGFVGNTTNANTFTSCKATASIAVNNTTGSYPITGCGGFIGRSNQATLTYCYATGSIAANINGYCLLGGLVGYQLIGSCVECGADVEITCPLIGQNYAAVSAIGGFIGQGGSTASIDCYAKGSVCKEGIQNNHTDRDVYVGGFIGTGKATTCYSVGEVGQNIAGSGNTCLIGGFVGSHSAASTACFWDTESSGWAVGSGGGAGAQTGLTGATTAEMKASATYVPAGSAAGQWDFVTPATWYIPSSIQPETLQSNLTVWLSTTGDYENFEAGTEDDNSFEVMLPSTNEIRWAESLKALLVGTADDEWKIASNKLDTPLSPTNFGAKRQTNFGSTSIQAEVVNEVILFVDFVSRKVYELTTGDMEGEYVSNDMTELSEHITDSGIVCMAHQKNPDSILWCVLDDGTLISMVYDRKQNVIAWSKHPLGGNGLCQSVCVVPGTSEDAVWISATRTLTGDTVTYDSETVTYEGETVTDYIGQVVYIEKMGSRILSDLEDAFFVDSGITFESDTPTSTITGLSHLDGETVKVLADGVVFDEAVVEDGEITASLNGTTTNVSKAQVGLAYLSILKPMRLSVTDPDGPSGGANTRVPELIINFVNTLAAQYGNSESSLYDIALDEDRWENEGLIDGLFTGHVRVSMEGGISIENPILIATEEPGPLNIRSIIPVVEQTGR